MCLCFRKNNSAVQLEAKTEQHLKHGDHWKINILKYIEHAEAFAGDGGNVLHRWACLPHWSLSVPGDCHEAVQDGGPHLLQQDVPRLLLRRFFLRQHWNILPLQVVDRQVIIKITLLVLMQDCYSALDDANVQLKNCTCFVTVWSLWAGNRQLIMEVILFTR